MEGLEVMIFMGLVLKIPVALACFILYWAWKAAPEPAEAPEDDGGHRFRRTHPRPRPPRPPRRGPHSPDALPLPCPERAAIHAIRYRPSSRPAVARSSDGAGHR